MTLPEAEALDNASLLDSESEEATVARPATRGLTPWLLIQSLALYGTLAAVNSVMIPNQLSVIDPANKISDFAVISTLYAVITVVSQPFIGAFADRTRSRFGRRALWFLVGAAIGAAALIGLSGSGTVWTVGLFAVVLSLGLNTIIVSLTAVLPDRYPKRKRGAASAMIGAGSLLGATIGSIIAGILAAQIGATYIGFAIALLVITMLFLIFNRDFSSKDMQVEPFALGRFFKAFWVSPRKHPEFAWAFVARFLFVLGFTAVSTFTFFLLTDYVGLSLEEANANVGIVGLAALPGMVIAVLVTGFLSDKLGRRKVFIYIGSGVLIVGLLVPLFLPTVLGIIIMTMLTGFGYGMYQASDVVLMTQVLPKGGLSAGKDLGILNIANGAPTALAPVLSAVMIGTLFGFQGLFIVAGVIVLVGALAIIPIKSVR